MPRGAAREQGKRGPDALVALRSGRQGIEHPREPAWGLGLGVEHQAGDEGAAHAVHQAVVDLARERPAAVGQPVDKVNSYSGWARSSRCE